jgi:hypothetical protein
MENPLAFRHRHAVSGFGKAAADARNQVGVVQEMMNRLRNGPSARA